MTPENVTLYSVTRPDQSWSFMVHSGGIVAAHDEIAHFIGMSISQARELCCALGWILQVEPRRGEPWLNF